MSTQDPGQCAISTRRKECQLLLLALTLGGVVACDSPGEAAGANGSGGGESGTDGATDVLTTGLPPSGSSPESGASSGVSADDGMNSRPSSSGGSEGSSAEAGGTASSGSGTQGDTSAAQDVSTTGVPSTNDSSNGESPDVGLGGAVDAGIGEPPGASGGSEDSTGGAEAGGAAFEGKELFILFGQSNMSGMSPMPDQPWPINDRVTFMVQYDCPSLGQTKDEWLPAEPPLHGCQWATGGIGLGLADHFGAGLAEAWPEAEIGLIPNAIPAVTIDVFSKGGPSPGGGQKALPDGYTSAYTLMVDRTREAQKLGRVRAILLHQGESDFNQGLAEQWLDTLTNVVSDLRTDLDLGEQVPFIAGEIAPTSNWSGHNEYIRQIPDAIPNSFVVSSEGTDIHDIAHFDAQSARLMGQRYVDTFLEHADPQ